MTKGTKMADFKDDTTEKYATRIAKLLAKAESTTSQEEADSFFTKAQALMTEHNITTQMIAQAGGAGIADTLADGEMIFSGIFMKQTMYLAFRVGDFNNVQCVYSQREDYVDGKRKKYIRVGMFGFKSDIANVEMLVTSLQLQCAQAMQRWAKDEEALQFGSAMEKFKEKREFILGFQQTIAKRLREGRDAGRRAAAEAATARGVQDATSSVALVVQSKEQLVADGFKKRYPRLGKGRIGATSAGSGAARAAGNAAGAKANLGGGTSIKGGGKAIGR
jgi:Protein of unknown function (DUF2786)